MSDGRRALAYLALLGQTAISATAYLLGKYAIGHLGWAPAVMLRNIGSSALFVVLLMVGAGGGLPPRQAWRRALLLGLLVVPANQALFFSGLGLTSPAHASLLFALTPLFVLLLGLWSGGEKFEGTKALGLALAGCGATLVILERAGPGVASFSLTGDLLVLAAVVAWALYTVLGRPFVREHGAVRTTGWSIVAGTMLFLPIGAPGAVRVDYTHQPAAVWAAMAFIVLFTGFLAYLCWLYALARLEPSRVAVFTNLQPLCVALLAWLVRGEPITPRLGVGGLIVTAGVLLATWRRPVESRVSVVASPASER